MGPGYEVAKFRDLVGHINLETDPTYNGRVDHDCERRIGFPRAQNSTCNELLSVAALVGLGLVRKVTGHLHIIVERKKIFYVAEGLGPKQQAIRSQFGWLNHGVPA